MLTFCTISSIHANRDGVLSKVGYMCNLKDYKSFLFVLPFLFLLNNNDASNNNESNNIAVEELSLNETQFSHIKGISNPFSYRCYMNAVLQYFMSDPFILERLLKYDGNDSNINIFREIALVYVNSNGKVATGKLNEMLKRLELSKGRQEDASEFLMRRCEALLSQLGLHPNGHIMANYLDKEKVYNLTQYFDKNDELSRDVEFKKIGKDYYKRMDLLFEKRFIVSQDETADNILIPINRSSNSFFGKIQLANNTRIDIPDYLMISDEKYFLDFIIVHIGRALNSGHYIAYRVVRDKDGSRKKIVLMDDENVYVKDEFSDEQLNGEYYGINRKAVFVSYKKCNESSKTEIRLPIT